MESVSNILLRHVLTISVFLTGSVGAEPSFFPSAIAQENLPSAASTAESVEASSNPAGARVDLPKSESEAIDEVTVMGLRSLGSLRSDIEKAEDNIYAVFNSLNDDDDYDVFCRRETWIGSQIKHRVCRTKGFRHVVSKSKSANKHLKGEHTGTAPMSQKRHNDILREKMRVLTVENPELVDALRKRLILRIAYEETKEKKFQ